MSSTFERLLGRLRGSCAAPPPRDPRPSRDRLGRVPAPRVGTGRPPGAAYPGDATRLPDTTYAPRPDGRPDPGEIVWTWVPYEEDHTQGKDRPVLVVGRDGDWLVGLPLTSKDHDRDERQERRSGREWVDIGSGAWDGRVVPSEVRVNRSSGWTPTGCAGRAPCSPATATTRSSQQHAPCTRAEPSPTSRTQSGPVTTR